MTWINQGPTPRIERTYIGSLTGLRVQFFLSFEPGRVWQPGSTMESEKTPAGVGLPAGLSRLQEKAARWRRETRLTLEGRKSPRMQHQRQTDVGAPL